MTLYAQQEALPNKASEQLHTLCPCQKVMTEQGLRTDIQNIQDTDGKNSDSDETATVMYQQLHEPMHTLPATPVPVIYSLHY